MINLINKLFNKENRINYLSYFVLISFIYSFIFVYYMFCLYLFINKDFQNILLIINANASVYSLIYVGILLFIMPFLLMSKFSTLNNFYTMYFSVLFGFLLNVIPIPLYDNYTKAGFITLLFLIVIITFFIQKKHFIYTIKNLSTTRIIFIIFFFNS
jgi:hypothetical protein